QARTNEDVIDERQGGFVRFGHERERTRRSQVREVQRLRGLRFSERGQNSSATSSAAHRRISRRTKAQTPSTGSIPRDFAPSNSDKPIGALLCMSSREGISTGHMAPVLISLVLADAKV